VRLSHTTASPPSRNRRVPRAPLPICRCYPQTGYPTLNTSEDVTLPSSLIRAHAPDQIPPTTSGFPLKWRVFAGCRQSLLGHGPSQHYLCNPCEVAWTHTPPRFLDAFTHFFSKNSGLTRRENSSARGDFPAMQHQQGRNFEAAVIRLSSGFFTR
jgi:hypothetical protein